MAEEKKRPTLDELRAKVKEIESEGEMCYVCGVKYHPGDHCEVGPPCPLAEGRRK